MNKGQTKRNFTEGFKLKVVRRIEEGEPVRAIAKELDVGNSLLYTWKSKLGSAKAKTNGAAPADNRHKDAIVYLRHARDTMGSVKKLNRSQLLTLLALDVLEGK